MRVCSSVIPAFSVVFAWILIYFGKAADYDAGDVVMDKQDDAEYSKEDEEVN